MRHPFQLVPGLQRRPVLLILIAAAIAEFTVLQVIDRKLQTVAAPYGMLSFQLAGDPFVVRSILQSWDQNGARPAAGFSLGFDYVFILTYAAGLALGCILVAENARLRMTLAATLGFIAAWLPVAAALCDCFENTCLYLIVVKSPRVWLPEAAQWASILKFGFVLVSILYLAVGYATLVLVPRIAETRYQASKIS